MSTYPEHLRKIVLTTSEKLISLSESIVSKKSRPNKWSIKEIIGHLIDSAVNNHRRFVLASYQFNFVFDGYEQDEWVNVQQYQNSSWILLVELWKNYNLHLASLMEISPENMKKARRHPHNLNKIGWKTVPSDQTTTLEYFMKDYIGHLEHHLNQVEKILSNSL